MQARLPDALLKQRKRLLINVQGGNEQARPCFLSSGPREHVKHLSCGATCKRGDMHGPIGNAVQGFGDQPREQTATIARCAH